jgi:hypothetical protein
MYGCTQTTLVRNRGPANHRSDKEIITADASDRCTANLAGQGLGWRRDFRNTRKWRLCLKILGGTNHVPEVVGLAAPACGRVCTKIKDKRWERNKEGYELFAKSGLLFELLRTEIELVQSRVMRSGGKKPTHNDVTVLCFGVLVKVL